MMSGGPIATTSKKLAHVGLSAFHNEYMALKHAASTVMWIRQLLAEIGCDHMVKAPTVIYGDNTAANTLTAKDFITTGNQHKQNVAQGSHSDMGAPQNHKSSPKIEIRL